MPFVTDSTGSSRGMRPSTSLMNQSTPKEDTPLTIRSAPSSAASSSSNW